MRKRIVSIVLTLCMVLALMPQMAYATDPMANVPYLDASGAPQTCGSATVVTSEDTSWGTGEQTTWYVVQDNVNIGVGVYGGKRITVNGNVNLILADGYTLNVGGGIQVSRGNSLTIYGQAGGTGKLIADARATSNYYAGIGGGSGDPNGDITINGGVVNAIGGLNSAGIGIGFSASGTGGKITINGGTVDAAADMQADNPSGAAGIGCGGSSGRVVIEINDGTVIATGYLGGAGIGGGDHDGTAYITINGGSVTATGNAGGAGIGTGQIAGYALITINGGIVTATGNDGGAGIGAGQNGGDAPTTINGNAVIFASSISNQSGKENNTWSGVIFESNSGKVYGTSVAPTDDFTIPADKILTIESGKVLAISQNNVTLTNNGKIYVDGTVSGTVGGNGDVYYNLALKNCTTDSTGMETYEEKNYAKAGSKITLTPDTPPTGYKFKQWSSAPAITISETNTFTMPSEAITVTAQFSLDTYTVNLNTNGGTINSGNVTDYTYGKGATLPTDVTKAGYIFKGWYENENFTGDPVTEISTTDTGVKKYYAKWIGNGLYPISQIPTIESGEGVKVTLSADGTVATITVDDGYEIADVVLNGISLGKVTEVKNLKTGDKLVVTAEKQKTTPTKEELQAILDSQKLVACSKIVTLKNGKKAVKITWTDENGESMDFDGVEIYRSTKRYSGYGKTPFFHTEKDVYYNTAIEAGNTYYYKVRGYIELNGEKIYTDWSMKAIRTVK